MTERTWHRDQILRYNEKQSRIIGFLKSENAAGKVYVRPALSGERSQGLVLVDDIDQVTVEDMKAQGLQPLWLKPPIATVRRG